MHLMKDLVVGTSVRGIGTSVPIPRPFLAYKPILLPIPIHVFGL
jgi:hypothetical protein